MTWPRLNMVVEGHTEEEFANAILKPHLSSFSVAVSARMVSHRRERSRKYKGGLLKFESLHRDVDLWMREDRSEETHFTTMVDLYAYPSDAPRYEESKNLSPYNKVGLLEKGLGESVNDRRFAPYIQLHEFETILYADLNKWQEYFLGQQSAVDALAASVASFDNIELINDDERTAPSKRILQYLPEYDKPAAGNELARAIGLPTIRDRCKHFDEWLTSLEKLGSASGE